MVIYCMDIVLLDLMFKKTIKKLLSVYECFTYVYVCIAGRTEAFKEA